MNRLQGEIRKLQDNMEVKRLEEREAEMERESMRLREDDSTSWKAKFMELEKRSIETERSLIHQVRDLQGLLRDKEEKLDFAQRNLESKDTVSTEKDMEIEDLKKKLEQSRSERDGLRMTLGD